MKTFLLSCLGQNYTRGAHHADDVGSQRTPEKNSFVFEIYHPEAIEPPETKAGRKGLKKTKSSCMETAELIRIRKIVRPYA